MTRSHPKINSFLSTKNQTNQFIFICKRLNKINTAHPAQRADTQIFLALRTRCLLDFASYMAIYIYQGTRHFFKAFLFQGFPFSRFKTIGFGAPAVYQALFQGFPFSRFSFFKAFLFYVILFQGDVHAAWKTAAPELFFKNF